MRPPRQNLSGEQQKRTQARDLKSTQMRGPKKAAEKTAMTKDVMTTRPEKR